MSVKDSVRVPSKITARELLVEVLGAEHALHSVAYKDAIRGGQKIVFHCTCGGLGTMPHSEVAERALANVSTSPSTLVLRGAND